MASERYVLNHFYYGQFVRDGRPGGDLRLLAKTKEITDEIVAEALRLAFLPPTKIKTEGGWAVVRGRRGGAFLFVDSEVGAAGQSVLHFVVLPSELVRALSGNLRGFDPILNTLAPEYETVGNTLKPLALNGVGPASAEQEVDDILDFMMATHNRMNVMQTLLGAVVKGTPLWIVNAPQDAQQRLVFLSGLLNLLPPSVRFAVTYATHTLPSTQIDVQVRFITDVSNVPDDTVVYNWQDGTFTGPTIDEDYSRFIVSQLRLDAELVVQQTRRLTQVASWRVKEGDRLADALAYASHRLSTDDAVLNGQPVEVRDASDILANDPTLSDELRLAYARHLMSFSVALGDLEYAEPLGIMLSQNAALAETAYNNLRDATEQGVAGDVYDLMEKWLRNPLGPQGQHWINLTHNAAAIYFKDMIDARDIPEIGLFLQDVDKAGINVMADRLMPKLLAMVKPLAPVDKRLAARVFVFGCRYLPLTDLAAHLDNPQFTRHLPEDIQSFLALLQRRGPVNQPNALIQTVRSFKAARRLILVRLVELTMWRGHPEAIDENVLKQLVIIGSTELGDRHAEVLFYVVKTLSTDDNLPQLSAREQRLLLAVLLSLGAYKELAGEMLRHARLLYSADEQTAYAQMIQQLFTDFPIPQDELLEALGIIAENGIKSLPLVMVHTGAIRSQKNPSDAVDRAAANATEMLERQPSILNVMPIDAMQALVAYYLRQRDVDALQRTVFMLPDVAARYGKRTVKMMGQIYQSLSWDSSLKANRSEMLRRYIRFIAPEQAVAAVNELQQMLGEDVYQTVNAVYAVKQLMNGQPIEAYAVQLQTAANFLHDTASAYVNGRSLPSIRSLVTDLDGLPGGLGEKEKRQLAQNLIEVGQLALQLGESHRRVRNSDSDKRINALLKAEANPQSAVEVMLVMSSHLAEGERLSVSIAEQTHPRPLPSRSGPILIEEVAITRAVLTAMLRVEGTIDNNGVQAEFISQWQDLPNDERKRLGDTLAKDLQRVAKVVPWIAAQGDARALEETGLGRRLENNRARPRNTIEFYRFASGYYLARA